MLAQTPPRDEGVRLIVTYKVVKAAAQLLFALILFATVLTGHAGAIAELATFVRHHVSGAWAVKLASTLLTFVTPRHVALTALALLLDGVLGAVEGWALHTGREWGEWLVVVASGALVPYEAYELFEHPRAGRALLMVANIAVVAYLARRALRRRRAHAV